MRFDDSLDTVLTAQVANPGAIQMMWRQAVDLIGRRRGGRREGAVARLAQIRDDVPLSVRAASARGLERANPPANLVALFVLDEPSVAAPVARTARLSAAEWLALLPEMHQATRGVLRHRRDLPEQVVRALESFGPSDFALTSAVAPDHFQAAATIWPPVISAHSEPEPIMEEIAVTEIPIKPTAPYAWSTVEAFTPAVVWPPVPEPIATELAAEPPKPSPIWPPVELEARAEPVSAPQADPPVAATIWPPVEEQAPPPAFVAPEPSPFVALADVARELPIVAEALRREQAAASAPPPNIDQDFQIAELVARIEAHGRTGERPLSHDPVAHFDEATPPTRFRFETDAKGVIRWCEGIGRGPVIGLSLAAGRDGAPATADASAAGALARRTRFNDARLYVPGSSPGSGAWRISGMPVFDQTSGRFTGYRGTARRPRADEEPRVSVATAATDTLRQLVHELRTPANAISGFAEMIVHEMLGPVSPAYREQATAIRDQTAGLLGAIDDLDTAARIESRSLDLRAETVPLAPLLGRIVGELRPLSELRGSRLTLEVAPGAIAAADGPALERLFSRLFAALLSNAAPGEAIEGMVGCDADGVRCELSRPLGLKAGDRALFSVDTELDAAEGGPLLGASFALRLAQRLATELGGALVIGPERLTLRLPAAVTRDVEQATV